MYTRIYGVGESGYNLWGVRRPTRVILVLLKCNKNAPAVSHVFPAFKDTGLLGSPPRWVVYYPFVSTLVTISRFLAGNREAELKPTTLSSLLLFRVFLSFLFSWPPRDIVPLSAACWGYSLINIYLLSITSSIHSKRETKLKKQIFPFMPLSCRLGHWNIFTKEFHIAVATQNCGISSRSWVHPPGSALCIPPSQAITIPPFSLLGWHSDLFFLSSLSQYQSISYTAYPLNNSYIFLDSLTNPILLHPLHMAKPPENIFINPFIYPLCHSTQFLTHAFRTLSLFLANPLGCPSV